MAEQVAQPASIGGSRKPFGRRLSTFFYAPPLLALLVLLLAPAGGAAQTAAVLLFVALYGIGNGLLTIVKGTAVAEYVSRAHAASLNGALGLPMALARAAAPWLLGLLWTPAAGYRSGLWVLLGLCGLGLLALARAQRLARQEPLP